MEFTVAAYTDIGTRKQSNQDSLCIRRAALPEGGELLLAVVCDGMGGLQKGELASAEAIRAFAGWFDTSLPSLPLLCSDGFGYVRSQWEALISALHQRLLGYAENRQVQLGTTLTAIFTFRDRYLTVNVGDSRLYENKRTLRQLTQDQSLVAQEIANGRITPDQARHHPQRNVLLQCLGAGSAVTPTFTEGTLLSDAVYLLCTDGFVHEVAIEEMARQLSPMHLNGKELLTEALTTLTETCKQRGETDNITSVLIKTSETLWAPPQRSALRRLFRKGKHDLGADPTQEATLVETAQIIHTSESI